VPKIEIINKKDSQLAEKNGVILALIDGDNHKFYNANKILIFLLCIGLCFCGLKASNQEVIGKRFSHSLTPF